MPDMAHAVDLRDEQIARLTRERDEARALLKELEWTHDGYCAVCFPACPPYQHAPTCRLAAALRAGVEKTTGRALPAVPGL